MTEKATECSWCDGTGMIEGDPCPYCDGTGKRLTAFPKATPRPWRQVGQHIVGANGNAVVVADTPFVVEAVNAYDRLQAEHEKAQVLYRQVEAWNQDGQPKGVACPDGYLLINKDRAADILVASHRYAKAVKEARGE